MSDANKYINTYVDFAMGMLHEQLSTIIQLKTQLKIATEILPDREALIASLQEQLQECQNSSANLSKDIREANDVKASYEAIKSKVSHMDALTAQLNEVKQALLTKSSELESSKAEVNRLNGQISQLNKTVDEKNSQLSEKEAEIVNLNKQIPPPKKVINRKKADEVEGVPVVVPVVDADTHTKDENDDF
jgi:chromosome segregation ATPase